jgi:ATP-dependent RNA helicase DDX47/RRP3
MNKLQYLFIPAKYKDVYLAFLLNEAGAGASCLVFTNTCASTQRLALMLRNLGFSAVCLHGQVRYVVHDNGR